MVKISIIIPVYNSEKFLNKCLESIVNQTLKDIEIICINDGSTDNSLSILNSFAQKDSRVIVINQDNQGQSCARNAGLAIAKGEYIGFVDSDDWIDLDFYEKLYKAAKKYDADIAAAGMKRLRPYKWKYHLKIKNEEYTENTDRKFLLCDVPDKCYIWNKIYKSSELKNYNIIFEPNVFYEDRFFTAEVFIKLKGLVTVPDTYYNYWTNNKSTVKTTSPKKSKDARYTYNKMMQYLKENNINLDHYFTEFKKIKLFGLTVLKIKTFKDKKQYLLCNCIKFEIKQPVSKK